MQVQIVIPNEKIIDYLLNEKHPDGGPKANFFINIAGFNKSEPEIFRDFLFLHYSQKVRENHTDFGKKVICESIVTSPKGKVFRMRSIWMLEEKRGICNFITAYPIDL